MKRTPALFLGKYGSQYVEKGSSSSSSPHPHSAVALPPQEIQTLMLFPVI